MNIGLDVDGVLVDTQTFQLREGERYFRKKYGLLVKNPDMFEVMDVFECTRKQREAFWIRYIWKYCLKEPMTKDAAKVVNQLTSCCYHNKSCTHNRDWNYGKTVSLDGKALAEKESFNL